MTNLTGSAPRSGRLRRRVGVLLRGGILLIVGVVLVALTVNGTLWPNRWFAHRYPVRGIDVSAYQGRIDWPLVARQEVSFAYIKATEGSSYTDARFARNWKSVHETGITAGAYHFLSLDSPAAQQADHLFDTVALRPGDLPIAIDVECYGRYCAHPPPVAKVRKMVRELVVAVAAHYGTAPVLYATAGWNKRYLQAAFPRNPLWIRSILSPPFLTASGRWTLWQWSDREGVHLDGHGTARVDADVFGGDVSEFRRLLG
ncbi:GH25 family lysozyme [Frondihabitans sucicola]|nr:GH25 family lysozyme [Frondihabitans sucicola]